MVRTDDGRLITIPPPVFRAGEWRVSSRSPGADRWAPRMIRALSEP
jgi:hypothetical protein